VIIHPPQLKRLNGEIQISARIEFQRLTRKVPQELWFRFPAEMNPVNDIDPFAVALLLLCMQANERMEFEGPISRKLHAGLQRYQQLYHSWFPDRFKLIEVYARSLREDAGDAALGEACAFSGGVDSFYSLIQLRSRITHALHVTGFDMPLHFTESIEALTSSYAEMMKELGITFIVGSTNVRAFVDSVDWTNAHGQALAASALFFRRSFGRFHVPSSYRAGRYPKWGTHPELDPLLSTEALRFSHHGDEANRVRKLEKIVRFSEAFGRLRVCWIQNLGLRNCGECEKCIRTMIALDLLEALPRFRTFERGTLTRAKIRSLTLRTHQARLFARELLVEAIRRRRWRIAADLAAALLRREWFYRFARKAFKSSAALLLALLG
jgi:hypothetical protein